MSHFKIKYYTCSIILTVILALAIIPFFPSLPVVYGAPTTTTSFETNAVDVSLGVTGSYQNIDLTSHIGEGATWVFIEVVNVDTINSYQFGLRYDGATYDIYSYIVAETHLIQAVGVSDARVIEGIIENTDIDFYLVGWTSEGNWLETPQDVTPGSTGWQDVDLSSYIQEGATGVVLEVDNEDGFYKSFGCRKKGSSDDYREDIYSTTHQTAFCGVDSNRECQVYVSDVDVKVYLLGWLGAGWDFYTNWDDKTPGTPDSWQEVTVAIQTLDAVIFYHEVTGTSDLWGARKEGSTDDRKYEANYYFCFGAIGTDGNGKFEFWTDRTTNELYIDGYHRSLVQEDYYMTGEDQDTSVGQTTQVAQTFTAQYDYTLNLIQFKGHRLGAGDYPHKVTVAVQGVDGSGKPDGSDLTTGFFDGDKINVGTPGEWQSVLMTPYNVTQGTQYALVIRAPSGNSGLALFVRFDTSSSAYAGGVMYKSTNGGSSWTEYAGDDIMFQTWGLGIAHYPSTVNAYCDNYDYEDNCYIDYQYYTYVTKANDPEGYMDIDKMNFRISNDTHVLVEMRWDNDTSSTYTIHTGSDLVWEAGSSNTGSGDTRTVNFRLKLKPTFPNQTDLCLSVYVEDEGELSDGFDTYECVMDTSKIGTVEEDFWFQLEYYVGNIPVWLGVGGFFICIGSPYYIIKNRDNREELAKYIAMMLFGFFLFISWVFTAG